MLPPRSVTLLSLCALLGACSSVTRGGPAADAGTLELVGRACNVDAECGALRCDTLRHQCICLSDESCKSANAEAPVQYCNNYTGRCVTEISGCTEDADCKDAQGKVDATQFCDASTRGCRPLKGFCEPCTADRECGGASDDCRLEASLGQKFCARACQANADCPRGASCQLLEGKKQCWPQPTAQGPSPTCRSFRGCVPDSLQTCNGNTDCAAVSGQRCDAARGKCVAVEQVCAFGTVCDPRNRICVAECSADADCGDARLRCTNKVCEPIGECSTDAQCPLNQVCGLLAGQTVGQCLPFCQTDSQCPLGQTCQQGGDHRYRCAPGCGGNASCPVEQRCNVSSHSCEGPVVGGVHTCQATVACGNCELCELTRFECFAAKTTFPYCSPCSSNTECAGGACVLMDDAKRYCAKFCGTGQECPQGFVCLSIGSGAQSACVPSNRQCQGKCL